MHNEYDEKTNKGNEDREDLLFRLAINNLAQKEGKLFSEENIDFKKKAPPSPENINRFSKLLDNELDKNLETKKNTPSNHLLYKLSGIVLFIVAALSAVVVNV